MWLPRKEPPPQRKEPEPGTDPRVFQPPTGATLARAQKWAATMRFGSAVLRTPTIERPSPEGRTKINPDAVTKPKGKQQRTDPQWMRERAAQLHAANPTIWPTLDELNSQTWVPPA